MLFLATIRYHLLNCVPDQRTMAESEQGELGRCWWSQLEMSNTTPVRAKLKVGTK
jgi:hypothetical protein